MTSTSTGTKVKKAQGGERLSRELNRVYQEATPLHDILKQKSSPVTQLADASKNRYTKHMEVLRQNALKHL
ncbi:hypothetical protein J416_06028 [Gracilibacillus halophilus YIM-C55.5]|uniref:Uncharacterized protein n=1 Tax=Gracilibacillus halophilus YIM-C55.5 TaxID=1308866 RepID=N4WWW4_9BACI|nr:hypothetical protein [Gracilibacillus halophilus]ENH97546.1 hypothetical protein J416_06028 [Gracilibacillus halophilus YIM-C55.5]